MCRYSTQLLLPAGNFIVIGGTKMFNFEYVPPRGQANTANIPLPFLKETTDKQENNLYPFAHLSPDGNVFLFANNRAILFDPKTGNVIRKFPQLKGGSRNYPSCGMSALLPLDLTTNDVNAEVLVCGGSVPNAAILAPKQEFPLALKTCGRISITKPDSNWYVEEMPIARTIGDMLLLPNTEVLIINGASRGCAGWDFARDPVLEPVLYRPYVDPKGGERFATMNAARIPRMYHSTGAVLPDASILIAGSNTNAQYNFTNLAMFPTDVSVEKFYPPYLDGMNAVTRPVINPGDVQETMNYGQKYEVKFTIPDLVIMAEEKDVMVTMYSPPFTTHGFSQNQRLLVLKMDEFNSMLLFKFSAMVTMPASGNIAPPGYYMLFVAYKGVPSKAVWVRLQ